MTGLLPPVVQWRPDKANLSGNFTRRLLACERETLDRVVLSDATVLDGYVDRSVLRSAYARYLSPQTRGADDAATVYRAVMLALWLET